MDYRRRSWGSAKELGYQECRKKQAVCQGGGVGAQTQEQSGSVKNHRMKKLAYPNAKLVGTELGDKRLRGVREQHTGDWGQVWTMGTMRLSLGWLVTLQAATG